MPHFAFIGAAVCGALMLLPTGSLLSRVSGALRRLVVGAAFVVLVLVALVHLARGSSVPGAAQPERPVRVAGSGQAHVLCSALLRSTEKVAYSTDI